MEVQSLNTVGKEGINADAANGKPAWAIANATVSCGDFMTNESGGATRPHSSFRGLIKSFPKLGFLYYKNARGNETSGYFIAT
jgi:hypothetical protein